MEIKAAVTHRQGEAFKLEPVELAEPALGHRMALAYDPGGKGPKLSDLIASLVRRVS